MEHSVLHDNQRACTTTNEQTCGTGVPRVAAHRIREILAADKRDAQTCDVAFNEGVTAGTKAIGSGAPDGAQADAALAALEQIIGW